MTTKISPEQQKKKNDSRSLTWYLICRTAVVTFLLGGAAFFYLRGSVNRDLITPLMILIGITYAEALISAVLLKKISRLHFFTQIQIIWDLLFVTVLILLTGGVESVFSFAYLLVIVSASFLLSRRLTILAAASSVILFGGILDFQFFNSLHFLHLYRSVPDSAFFSAIFVHSVAFFLTAILSGTLAERWRSSEEKLQRKTIDYTELEKMNRTILSHISSGLMLINPAGRIRSFNRAATDITGLSLADVYDQLARDLFPGLVVGGEATVKPLNRSEGYFTNQNGEKLIFGYATTPAKDSQGKNLGILVTFQDLTQLKKIEEELKQADRLAAIGRLAAGMAHEIRNPLASISGSVQLLMEAKHAQPDDLHLMDIVVKEADRLNSLLSDFLSFARPKRPVKEPVDVILIFKQLSDLLHADPRFENIKINCRDETGLNLTLDQSQFLQALWDLAVNAAEAMPCGGELHFRVDGGTIIVEDNGPGVPMELRGRIFEPFFSTKEKGTGLGLASAYSILEAHGGTMTVGESTLGGARFCLQFGRGE